MKRNFFFGFLFIVLVSASAFGQDILSRTISLEVSRQRLDNVLEIISNKGNFYFSYNSQIVKRDSLVTLSVSNRSIRSILDALFNSTYEFKESGNYIIIRKAPIRLTVVAKKNEEENRIYSVSGHVYDEESGSPINEASIYEKKILVSALTNNSGYFKIKLKGSKKSFAELTISKEDYSDTTLVIESFHNQEVTVTLMPLVKETGLIIVSPLDYVTPDSLKHLPSSVSLANIKIDSMQVERSGVGKFLLSSKQRVQSLNLKNFFISRPFQVSFTPGLSTHGKLAPQVVNNFSLNVLGGYTAGTNGIEIGGLFNLNKKEVKYAQLGGLFNVVGGKVTGVQFAGINNTVLDTVNALQASGLSNIVKGNMNGVQLTGVYNHVSDTVKGLQAAGVINFANKKVSGVQIAGVINFTNKETSGAQIGLINYSRKLKGVQVGLINIADTSDGLSIGLINIVLKGYHKLSLFADEVTNVNTAFKTGSNRLYSIFRAGVNAGDSNRVYSLGYGMGTELSLNRKKNLALNIELSSQHLYLGSWNYLNLLNRLHVNFNFKVHKYISLFAGPSFAVYYSDQTATISGYRSPLSPAAYKTISFGNNVSGWFGWSTGINFF